MQVQGQQTESHCFQKKRSQVPRVLIHSWFKLWQKVLIDAERKVLLRPSGAAGLLLGTLQPDPRGSKVALISVLKERDVVDRAAKNRRSHPTENCMCVR